ncbi:MAG: YraN family protein [Treponema sp.]|nr:YraN family protein [Candidatus Treponema caballi]
MENPENTAAQHHESTRQIGNEGEDTAAAYLQQNGYAIIDRNWRTRRGEIDIVAEKDSFIVFAEVKRQTSFNLETLREKLNAKKQKTIVETAKCYLAKHRQYNCKYVRFDVLVVDMPGLEPVFHIENAFSE